MTESAPPTSDGTSQVRWTPVTIAWVAYSLGALGTPYGTVRMGSLELPSPISLMAATAIRTLFPFSRSVMYPVVTAPNVETRVISSSDGPE